MVENNRVYQRPETVPIYSYVKDWSTPQQYYDPTTSIKITIYNPDGTAHVTDQDMTKLSVGKYVFYHLTEAGDQDGWYRYVITAIDGSGGGARTTVQDGGFQLQ